MHFSYQTFVLALATIFISFSPCISAGPTSSSTAKEKPTIEIRDGITHTIYTHEPTNSTLDIVKNSGICETTPGVNQYSGYITVGQNMSMFFWFFEARHSPSTAPLALWINGGPGCSSMIGLFQENGPCQFSTNATTPSLNKYSWNEYANMLYVDEPIGTGFSYGSDTVVGTVSAAPFVWKLMQGFFHHFEQYECRDFGLWTESYGGHYGPEFASYFQQQNDLIESGRLEAKNINLIALGVNNGWFSAALQEPAYISFSVNNTYYPLINTSIATSYLSNMTATCLPALKKCTSTTNQVSECYAAHEACNKVDGWYGQYYPDVDGYDIRQKGSGVTFPGEEYVGYLSDPTIMKKIGAKVKYSECSDDVDRPFAAFGDGSRSFLPALSSVVQSGVTVLIWAGDADSVCDWFGGFAAVNAIDFDGSKKFRAKDVKNYTVDRVSKGTYKTTENLSWLRVFESGHEVPAFQPALSLQVFIQTMKGQAISAT